MADGVIREFLVRVGYQVDGQSEQRFNRSAESAGRLIGQLAAAMTAAAAAAVYLTQKISQSYEELHYAAQRTGASIDGMKAMSYAVSQLGGSYEGARSAIESFGQKLRTNPGYESMLRGLGVVTRENGKLRDTSQLMTELAEKLKSKPYYVQVQYAEALGIDERTFRALQSGDLARWTDEYRRKQQRLGVDHERGAEQGKQLSQAFRSLAETMSLLGEKLAIELGPSITAMVRRWDEFLQQNSDKIIEFFRRAGDALSTVVDWIRKMLPYIRGAWEHFDRLTRALTGQDGVTVAFEALATLLAVGVITRIARLLGLVTALRGAFALLAMAMGLLTRSGAAAAGVGAAEATAAGAGAVATREAAKRGLLGRVGGAIGGLFTGAAAATGIAAGAIWAASTSPTNVGEDEEIARRRAEGTWGPGKAPSKPPPDTRNLWQKIAPTWLGGREPDKAAGIEPVQGSSMEIPKEGRALLDVIASSESGGKYNKLYGGGTFDDYSKHPEVPVPITSGPNAGRTSSAAGRYQFIGSTWKKIARKYGLRDFSPESQDKGAWYLAQEAFARKTGGASLAKALQSGDPEVIAQAAAILSREWTSLPGGIEQTQKVDTFMRRYNRALSRQAAREGGQSVAPDAPVAENPRTSGSPRTTETDTPETQPDTPKASDGRTPDRSRESDAKPPTPPPLYTPTPGARTLQVNPALTGGAPLGGFSTAPLTSYSTVGDSNVSFQQRTEINVMGGGDPAATAGAIAQQQSQVNGTALRNLQDAVR